MKNCLTLLVMGLTISLNAQNISSVDAFFTKADNFLAKNVENGLVDYAGIKNTPEELDALVLFMELADINSYDNATKKAFWINAYNLSVIKSVVHKYPISSPLDVSGFFKVEKHKVARMPLSFDDIENKILKALGPDARLHFVLVCAAVGCPKLASYSYKPAILDAQLETRTKEILNDDSFVKVDDSNETINLSEIFTWYSKDFNADGGVRKFINKYRTSKIPAEYGLDSYTYDWSLNEKKK